MNFGGPWGMMNPMNPMGTMVPFGYGPQPFFCNGTMPFGGMPCPQMNMMAPSAPFQDSMPSCPTNGKITRYLPDTGKGARKQTIVFQNGSVLYAEVVKYK